DRFGVRWQLTTEKDKDKGENFLPALMYTGKQAGKAEEAMHFYCGIFPDSSVSMISRYSAKDKDVEGYINHGRFQLNGKSFIAMDSSLEHNFVFAEGVSIVVECEDQEEIDHYWNKLTD